MSVSLPKRALWRFLWFFYALCLTPIFRPRIKGKANIPAEGPVLLLSNHTSLLDPPHVAWPCWRVVHFMASDYLFRMNWPLRLLITSLNAFPKAKGIKDRKAMLDMMRRYSGGDIVNLYPEGERTWTGRPLPIVPSTPRMLKRIKARVIYARIKTGHLFHPRWAKYPRWVPMEIEYSPLFVYDDPSRSDEEILKEIEDNIRVDPETTEAPRFSFGFRLAHGLPAFLWACPQCLALDGLSIHPRSGSAILCRACGAAWRVDLSQRLIAMNAQAQDTRVVTAHEKILAHFSEPPVADPARYERDGVVLESPGVVVSRIHRGVKQHEHVGTGTARLTPARIGVYDDAGAPVWEKDLADIRAVVTQVGNRFQLRMDDDYLQLDPPAGSSLRWHHFTRQHWLAGHAPAAAATAEKAQV